ncbi:hypothetical protein A500_16435 [Clostridium sartagoforme AAU1]|uniref:Uncharacterized protein n=1 Tax=Clostridium sartagoforme AAU1 TaxID=1202534 RepID=R9BTZ4_9CLOT|nr:hypothetical protein [Clostridium sartagoforme]EOR20543.1 hypothetical protein A500_16435 [Clostridium sartagoforme AAU1]
MKRASFIVGLIGGILGVISSGMLLFSGLNMKVTEAAASKVIMFAIIGLLLSILALVGACINNKKVLTGIFILIGAIANIPCTLFSISADNPITFIMCAVVAILLLVAGIMRLCVKE